MKPSWTTVAIVAISVAGFVLLDRFDQPLVAKIWGVLGPIVAGLAPAMLAKKDGAS